MTTEQLRAHQLRIGKQMADDDTPGRASIGPRIDEQYSGHSKPYQNGENAPESLKHAKARKFRNKPTDGFDSKHEAEVFVELEILRKFESNPFKRPVHIMRQVPFELTPAQGGERAWTYYADFLVLYADGHYDVIDAKSDITRRESAWIHKRKMMLDKYGISVEER